MVVFSLQCCAMCTSLAALKIAAFLKLPVTLSLFSLWANGINYIFGATGLALILALEINILIKIYDF